MGSQLQDHILSHQIKQYWMGLLHKKTDAKGIKSQTFLLKKQADKLLSLQHISKVQQFNMGKLNLRARKMGIKLLHIRMMY